MPEKKSIKVLNTEILHITEDELMKQMDAGVLVTPNLDHLYKLQKDKEFYECYKKAEWVVCDSRILYFVSKLLRTSIPQSISGSSFFPSFYNYHKDDPECKIFLLGAMNGVAKKAMENINEKVGRQIVVGAHSPSLGFEKNKEEIDDIVEIINQSGASVVLVGVGAPKQEVFIQKYKERMPDVRLWMALGATIDFEAGNKKRAPKWVQKIAMEWLYRLLCEPKRMFKRYIVDDTRFFWYFFKQLTHCYKDPFANSNSTNEK